MFGRGLGSFCSWQNFESTLAKIIYNRSKFHCWKWPDIEKHNLAIWSHCSTVSTIASSITRKFVPKGFEYVDDYGKNVLQLWSKIWPFKLLKLHFKVSIFFIDHWRAPWSYFSVNFLIPNVTCFLYCRQSQNLAILSPLGLTYCLILLKKIRILGYFH